MAIPILSSKPVFRIEFIYILFLTKRFAEVMTIAQMPRVI